MTNLRYIVRAAALFRLVSSSGDTDGSLVERRTALHTTSRRTSRNELQLV